MRKCAAALCLLFLLFLGGEAIAAEAQTDASVSPERTEINVEQDVGSETAEELTNQKSKAWFSGKTWVAYGDSITAGYTLDNYVNSPGNNQEVNSYVRLLAQEYGMTYYNYGLAGSGYTDITTSNFESMLGKYQQLDADIVTVALGTNDFGKVSASRIVEFGSAKDAPTEDTFCGRVRSQLTLLMAVYPDAELFVILPCGRRTMNQTNYVGKNLADYREAIREIAEDIQLSVIDPEDYVDIRATDEQWCETYMPDGLHFNELGHQEYLLPMIENGLLDASEEAAQPKKKLEVSDSLTMLRSESVSLTTSEAAVQWLSTDWDIATVNQNGAVDAVQEGEMDIIAVLGHSREVCHVTVRKLDTPQVTAEFDGDAVQLSWQEIEGAKEYQIYRRAGTSGSWTMLDRTQQCVYTDTGIDFQTNYSYAVRARAGSSRSDYKSVSCDTTLKKPSKFTASRASYNSIALKWSAVKGATGYRVYEKQNGKWKKLTETNKVSFNHTGLKANSSHTYTVRPFRLSGETYILGEYSEDGVTASTALPKPGSVKAVSTGVSTVKISWNKVSDADGYRVYRKTQSGWKKVADTTALSAKETGLTCGSTYTYTVRAYENTKSGRLYGLYSGKGVSVRVVPNTPELTGASASAQGIRVKWNTVSGAHGYVVYRKTGDEGWKSIKKLSGGSTAAYTDKDVKSGKTYTYTVRAYRTVRDADVLSGYEKKGVTACMQPGTPVLSAVSVSGGNAKVSWKQVKNAEGYVVYRKTGSGGWKSVQTVTGTSYTDQSGLTEGSTYLYTVRAYWTADGKRVLGGYDSGGIAAHIVTPKLTAAEVQTEGVCVSWESIKDADGYKIYRKTEDGAWDAIGTVKSSAEYLDGSELEAGITYLYTVRAYWTADSKNTWSDYDHAGVQAEIQS